MSTPKSNFLGYVQFNGDNCWFQQSGLYVQLKSATEYYSDREIPVGESGQDVANTWKAEILGYA